MVILIQLIKVETVIAGINFIEKIKKCYSYIYKINIKSENKLLSG